MMRSVDDWPLAKILIQISGGKPRSVAVGPFGGRRDRSVGILLLRGVCHRLGVALAIAGAERVATCGGPALEELSGGNWMARYTDR